MKAHTVLFVDDDAVLRKTVALSLTKVGGYAVTTADSGRLAVTIAQTSPPDVILLDAQMPDMDGRATFEALRADPRTARIPIIFLTASSSEAAMAFVRLGARGVIAKPFKPLDLAAEIARLLADDGASEPPLSRELAEAVEASLAGMREGYGARLSAKVVELEEALAEAVSNGSFASSEQLAHRLHGTAGTYGFDDVSAAAEAVEIALREARTLGQAPPRERLAELCAGLARARSPLARAPAPDQGVPEIGAAREGALPCR